LLEQEDPNKAQEETAKLLTKAEVVIGSCIGRVTLGLKEARDKIAQEISMGDLPWGTQSPVRREKIQRNMACPCGSGKKYKKCCGRTQ
jgi:preprotein translocase subunit SecA